MEFKEIISILRISLDVDVCSKPIFKKTKDQTHSRIGLLKLTQLQKEIPEKLFLQLKINVCISLVYFSC